MVKDKQYFWLIEIDVIVKKENGLHLFYSIYSIFYLIPKIYSKIRMGVGCTDNFFFFIFLLCLLLLLVNLMIAIIFILLLSLLFIVVLLFLCLFYLLFCICFILYNFLCCCFFTFKISCMLPRILNCMHNIVLCYCVFCNQYCYLKIEKSNKYYS